MLWCGFVVMVFCVLLWGMWISKSARVGRGVQDFFGGHIQESRSKNGGFFAFLGKLRSQRGWCNISWGCVGCIVLCIEF